MGPHCAMQMPRPLRRKLRLPRELRKLVTRSPRASKRNPNGSNESPMTEGEAPMPVIPLPSFSNPLNRSSQSNEPNGSSNSQEMPAEPTQDAAINPNGESSMWEDIRTNISLDGERRLRPPFRERTVTPEHTSKIVAGLLKVVVVVAERVMSRAGRDFRRPTEKQMKDISTPSAALLVRYAPLGWAPDGLVDLTDLAAAVSDYALDGPLTTPKYNVRQIGMPQANEDMANAETLGTEENPTVKFLD